MKQIPLTRGKFALVDDEDYEWLMQWTWYADSKDNTWYASRQYRDENIKNKHGDRKQIWVGMHREIMNAPKGKNIDHINHNGLDNRRKNLRFCTHAQNLQNQRRITIGKPSRYKGVTRLSHSRKWQVQICANGINHYLGCFTSSITAAKEYDKLARILHGEFACTNFD